jgi:hypothetical protein
VDERLRDLVDDAAILYVVGPLLLLMFAGWEWFAALTGTPRQPFALFIAALAFGAVSAFRFPRVIRKAQALRLGRDGERYMAQVLEGLREEGARIFHDIPADGFNLDHVVVSAKGVYVIETKARSKGDKNARVTFDGTNIFVEGRPALGNPIGQARGGASWLARLIESASELKVPVRPVVAFPDWFVECTGRGENSHAWVLSGRAVPGRISREPPTLTMREVAAVSHAIAVHVTRHDA